MIVDFILKNCNNQDCSRAVKMDELARKYKCNDIIKDAIHHSESHIQNQMHQSSVPVTNVPAVCSWYPSSTSSCDIENKIPSALETNVRNPNPASDNSTKPIISKGSPKSLGFNMQEATTNRKVLSNIESSEKNKSLKVKAPLRIAQRSFRKPRNVVDFRALLSAAEQYTDYPAVLYNPKTKFLGSFGLAPKRICSKRTLSRIEKEKKRKKAQYMQDKMYNNRNRKNLRDRNKLNKIKLKEQLEKPAYLDKFKRNSEYEVRALVAKSGKMNDDSYYVDGDESNNVINSADDSEIEIVEVESKNAEPEVIEIVSSDDENNCESLKALLTDGIKNTASVKNDSEKTETLSSQQLGKASGLRVSQQDKKATDCARSAGRSTHPGTLQKYYPIFKQPYPVPPNSKREVAVSPASQCSLKVPSNQNKSLGCIGSQISKSVSSMGSHVTKSVGSMNSLANKPPCSLNSLAIINPVCSMHSQAVAKPVVCSMNSQDTKSAKFTKDMMQGKKAIQQPITSVMGSKSLNMPKLPTPGIANKIPHGTNVYLMQKQPSGLIKMVPCSRVDARNNTSAQCSKEILKEDRPISVVNPVNYFGVPNKTKYRSIRPAPDGVEERNRQKLLDANKHFIDEEMTKLSKWIGGMQNTMARTYFQLNVQRSKQRLESQLNAAIALVKNIRRKLHEIEKLEEKVNCNISPKDAKNVM